jgi:short-subunit dehydrogenase
MNPIGPFEDVNFDEWEAGFRVNFLTTLRVMRGLLPLRDRSVGSPIVILFAGGGVNSAPINFSAYTAAKIALIKMIELLAEEMSDTRFVILGPGWVDTKIHQETLQAATTAVEASKETRRRLKFGDFVPMERVLECIDWAISEDSAIISGRNFSVAHDRWGEIGLREKLTNDRDMYKLRRCGNEK